MFKYSHKKYINFAGIFAFAFPILALFLLEKYPGIFPGSAFVYYETLKAKMGSVSSQSTLGKVYFYDLDPDYSRAFYWWSVAAKNGDDNAACELGREYFSGKYIQKDLKKSFDLYNSASETCGIYGLYKFYESGVVVDKDVKKSLSILEGIKSKQTNDFSNDHGMSQQQGTGEPQKCVVLCDQQEPDGIAADGVGEDEQVREASIPIFELHHDCRVRAVPP